MCKPAPSDGCLSPAGKQSVGSQATRAEVHVPHRSAEPQCAEDSCEATSYGAINGIGSCVVEEPHHPGTMRLTTAITTLLLPLGILAAKSAPDGNFDAFHAQQVSSSGSPVKLDDKLYAELTKTPRDYSVAVLLTALHPDIACGLCHEFQPEWEMLSKSWLKGDKKSESRVVFGTLDFQHGRETFKSVRLC